MRHTTKRKMLKLLFVFVVIFLSLWVWQLARNYDPIEVVAIVGSAILVVAVVSSGLRLIALKWKGSK